MLQGNKQVTRAAVEFYGEFLLWIKTGLLLRLLHRSGREPFFMAYLLAQVPTVQSS